MLYVYMKFLIILMLSICHWNCVVVVSSLTTSSTTNSLKKIELEAFSSKSSEQSLIAIREQ